jgi:histidyl-tRNA synthetase
MGAVESTLDAYAIVSDVSVLPLVLQTLQTLRAVGISVQMHTSSGEGMGSMKSQFKRADSSGARHALIFGADEFA